MGAKVSLPSAQEISRSSRSNFIASFWFLQREKRAAMHTIYAFCRLTDDIVDAADGTGRETETRIKAELDEWRRQTLMALRGEAGALQSPVLQDLATVVSRYQIPEEHFLGLIEGCRMDLEKRAYARFKDLYSYCYRVASEVGLMCLRIFGVWTAQSREFAVDLGIAFQLTNILRDVKSDLEQGRVYLPEEDLIKFGFSGNDFLQIKNLGLAGSKRDDFEKLITYECERAEHFYLKAKQNLNHVDRPHLIAAEVMSAVYHAILQRIHDDPLSVLKSKVRLSRMEAGFRIFQGWLANKLALQ